MTTSRVLGIVLIPDVDTRREACVLNKTIGGNLVLNKSVGSGVPHITLFQGTVDTSTDDAERYLIQEVLSGGYGYGEHIYLSLVTKWGGPFTFWDVDAETRRRLFPLHFRAVSVFCGPHLAPRDPEPVTSGQGVTLSEREQVNNIEFGYPFVGADFRPHITIAHGGINQAGPVHRWGGRIDVAALVRTGPFGSVAEVLAYKKM